MANNPRQTVRRQTEELLEEIHDKIIQAGQLGAEHRWYEYWNPTFSYVAQASNTPWISVAPQHSLIREILSNPEDEDDPDASTEANTSLISTSSSSVASSNSLDITNENRIPDFLVLHTPLQGRSLLILAEIKPVQDVPVGSSGGRLHDFPMDLYRQVSTQVAFAFEHPDFQHQNEIFAFIGIGSEFQWKVFSRKDVTGSLPSYAVDQHDVDEYVPQEDFTALSAGWSRRYKLLRVINRRREFSQFFIDAINMTMGKHGIQTRW